jgi:hypothetical protein
MSLRASKVQRRDLLRRETKEIQPDETSVAVRVRIYRSEVVCPQYRFFLSFRLGGFLSAVCV